MLNRSLRVIALALAAMAGCGGATSTGSGRERVELGKIPEGVLMREQQPRFSPETLMLASRESAEIWIPLALLSEIEADLVAIRKTYPQLAAFEVPIFMPDMLLVTLKPDAPFADAWKAGRLESGEAELDAALRHFNAVSVRRSYSTTVEVQFAQSLNLERLGPVIEATSPTIEMAYGDSNAIMGPELHRSKAADARTYTFIAGCGVPDGCTDRHTWIVRFAPGGGPTMRETITP